VIVATSVTTVKATADAAPTYAAALARCNADRDAMLTPARAEGVVEPAWVLMELLLALTWTETLGRKGIAVVRLVGYCG